MDDWKQIAERVAVFLFQMLLQLIAVPMQCVLFALQFFIAPAPRPKQPGGSNGFGIVITGASSGIGEGLALNYAAPGVTLCLIGRNPQRLADVAARCEAKGARVVPQVLDVLDVEGMRRCLNEFHGTQAIDLVFANAGVSENSIGVDRGDIDTATRVLFDININGVMNTILPTIPLMQQRGSGQLVLLSSLAGLGSMTASHVYCATKACVKTYGEGLRGVLARDGIAVNVVAPGYIKSAMTDLNKFPMPFKWPMDRAVRFIRRGLERNDALISFPWQLSSLRLMECNWTLPEIRDFLGRLRLVPHLAWFRSERAEDKAEEENLVVARPVAGECKRD